MTDQQFAYQEFAAIVSASVTFRYRKTVYDELKSQIREGCVLFAECRFTGAEKLRYYVVENFVVFNALMDKLDNAYDALDRVQFQSAMEKADDTAH